MPTTSMPRPEPGKKNLPVKWRDNAWCPLIVIRPSGRRIAARSLCGFDTRASDIAPRQRDRAIGRAGRPLRPSERLSLPGNIPPSQRLRFFNTSGSDTSSEP
jgi:hypothetical protein